MCIQGFCGVRDHLEDAGADWRITFGRIFSKWDAGGKDWIYLPHDRDRCRALVNAVMDIRVP
jgi:hypothetical protein